MNIEYDSHRTDGCRRSCRPPPGLSRAETIALQAVDLYHAVAMLHHQEVLDEAGRARRVGLARRRRPWVVAGIMVRVGEALASYGRRLAAEHTGRDADSTVPRAVLHG